MIRIGKPIFVQVLILWMAAGALAGPRDLTIAPVADTQLPYLIQVVSPQAHCAAISDTLGLMAIGNRAVASKAGEISIFGLDAQGKIVGQPAATIPPGAVPAPGAVATKPTAPPPLPKPLFTITLPRPASLAPFGNAAVSVAFHPKLPLLYIWQDTTGPAFTSAKDNAVMKEFDHLLIYSVSPTAPPQLLQALGRGQEYYYGMTSGSIVIDAAAARIYMPNLRMPQSPDTGNFAAIGFFKLDAKGLPVRVGDKPDLTLDDLSPYNYFPQGMGMVPISNDVMIIGAFDGPATLDRANRRGHWLHFQLTPLIYYSYRLAGHPVLPVVYLCSIPNAYLFRMEHSDGYLTLLPQVVSIGNAINSPPVVMATRKKIAIGGTNRVHVVGIDDEGWFINAMEQMAVPNPNVEALVYSEKFDRLYVAVEQAPQ